MLLASVIYCGRCTELVQEPVWFVAADWELSERALTSMVLFWRLPGTNGSSARRGRKQNNEKLPLAIGMEGSERWGVGIIWGVLRRRRVCFQLASKTAACQGRKLGAVEQRKGDYKVHHHAAHAQQFGGP
jgi:hypothetical protein